MSEDKLKRIQELIKILNDASRAYYADGAEIMSNYEYDALYDELEALEAETGIHMSDSPTSRVGYEVLSELPKERHESPMLSLSKTKERTELAGFLGDKKGLLSWKMDGLTIVLSYKKGVLEKAVTRGNGETGEIVTPNARVFKNIPLKISFEGDLTLRGEAVITYSDFERINESIPELDAKYKNPRNLCSGSVRQLDSRITKERNVRFYAFGLVSAEGMDFDNSRKNQQLWLEGLGFDIVGFREVDSSDVADAVGIFEGQAGKNDFPSDGLVLEYDDIKYGESLGRTAKFPRNAIAFKWQDETAETVLRKIEWSASRTGLINPIAVFDTVELEGTSVSRASLHNVSYIKDFKLGIGDRISVFKANMIIPQIAENHTGSGNAPVPRVCPVCGGDTYLKKENDVETLYCVNADCPAKHIKSFVHFVSRDALNIEGLSEATLEKFIQKRFLQHLPDLYGLEKYREEITGLEGFGERSCEKLLASVERSRHTALHRLLYGLGIPGFGVATCKLVARCFDTPDKLLHAGADDLVNVDGVGEVLARDFIMYFQDDENREQFIRLTQLLEIESYVQEESSVLAGKIFVITGSLNGYGNRSELKDHIESLGGKVSGTVSKNTSYLINNDAASVSSKNKKARELGVKIITEDEFRNLVNNGDLM